MAVNTLVVCENDSNRQDIEELIAEEQALALVGTVRSSQSRKSIESLLPELVWIDLEPAPVRGLSLLAELKPAFPEISFFVSYSKADPELMRTAYRLHACEFLDHQSWKGDLAESVKRIQSRHQLNSTSEGGAASLDQSRSLSTLLVCDANMKKRQTIEDLIWSQPSLTLAQTVSTAIALDQAVIAQPKLIWIELGPDPKHALSVLADLKEKLPHTCFFVSYDVADSALIRASFRLGASDFLDAERWRTDIGPALKSILPKERQKFLPSYLVICLIILAALGYWIFNH